MPTNCMATLSIYCPPVLTEQRGVELNRKGSTVQNWNSALMARSFNIQASKFILSDIVFLPTSEKQEFSGIHMLMQWYILLKTFAIFSLNGSSPTSSLPSDEKVV